MTEQLTLEEGSALSRLLKVKAKVLLLGFFRQGAKEEGQEHLDELELLTKTFGLEIGQIDLIPIRKIATATYIGKGKVQEIKALMYANNLDAVIFDEEISPAQQRNLEKALGVSVIDRAELILGVFAQRAKTKEAHLQIAVAEVQYHIPRLKRMWSHLSRQAGGGSGGVFVKGEGEKQIELDRRMLEHKLSRLQKELKEVQKHRQIQRSQRKKTAIPTFALVGYTNVGKSTLINYFTDANVLQEDKLFATLDTTTRHFRLPNNQEVLLIDTVGFIRKLPHSLIEAFKSTLEEAAFADILIHIVDASHHNMMEQYNTTMEVLKELGCHDKPMILCINKMDNCYSKNSVMRLKLNIPKCIELSRKEELGIDQLMEFMQREVASIRRNCKLRVPQKDFHIINKVLENGVIHHQEYDENDILLTVEVPVSVKGQVRSYLIDEEL